MAQLAEEWITPEEYLRREALSEAKHEYRNGRMYPLGRPPEPPEGGARRRALIQTNLVAALREGLRDLPCETYASGVAVGGVDFDAVVAREPAFEEDRTLLTRWWRFPSFRTAQKGRMAVWRSMRRRHRSKRFGLCGGIGGLW